MNEKGTLVMQYHRVLLLDPFTLIYYVSTLYTLSLGYIDFLHNRPKL